MDSSLKRTKIDLVMLNLVIQIIGFVVVWSDYRRRYGKDHCVLACMLVEVRYKCIGMSINNKEKVFINIEYVKVPTRPASLVPKRALPGKYSR